MSAEQTVIALLIFKAPSKGHIMKHKNILLIVFFLTLFVFQQVQAGATVPTTGRPSEMNVPLANTVLLSVIKIRIFPVDNSGAQYGTALCHWPDDNNGPLEYDKNGCPINEPMLTGVQDGATYDCDQEVSPRPVSDNDVNGKFYYLCVDHDYLPDVVAKEMDVATIPPHNQALKAQAVASRTVASWKAVHSDAAPNNVINNSTTFQAYEPGSSSGSSYDTQIRDAVYGVNGTAGEFLQYVLCGGNCRAIDAEFSNDIGSPTGDGNVNETAPYLIPVQEPISTCDLQPLGNGWGMSQVGAIRWARGNQCPSATGGNISWSVKWDYKQILAHYYSGVDFKNDDTNSLVAPNDRWNLIWHDVPSQMNSGQSADICS
jgi:hypothetical protein